MKKRFKLGLVMAPYFILLVYLATLSPDRLQHLPHWALWCGLGAFVGTMIAAGIVLVRPRRSRGSAGAEAPEATTGSRKVGFVMAKTSFVVLVAMMCCGWAAAILTLIIWAIDGRVPWAVPIICAPIFAFLAYGLIKTVPNIK